DREPREQRARERALRVARFLHHVDGVLEADEREECERGAADDERERVAVRVELERLRRVAEAGCERAAAGRDYDQEPRELDARQQDVQAYGLRDAAKVD